MTAQQPREPALIAEYVWHLRVLTPHWDTKTRCSCGADFVSQCEMWKHQADAYEELAEIPDWLSGARIDGCQTQENG